MKAYKYDKNTKEYLGTQEAQLNPLEGGYLLPKNCTFVEPDSYTENQIPVFGQKEIEKEIEVIDYDEEGNPIGSHIETITEIVDYWEIKGDFRGYWQVNLNDITFSKVDYIGEIQKGYQVISDDVYENYQKDNDRYKVIDGVFTDIIDTEEYREIKAQKRETEFNAEFFQTSLGYIRRAVNMANGTKKDFLSDLLPAISMSVQTGQAVNIIAYDKPDFTEEITDWTQYQHIKQATPQFIQECFLTLSNDFLPINEEE